MDIKELTALLVKSSESVHRKYIPWWEDDFEYCTYRYDIFKEEEVQAIEACVSETGSDAFFEPVGSVGLNLFALLVWHSLCFRMGQKQMFPMRQEEKAIIILLIPALKA